MSAAANPASTASPMMAWAISVVQEFQAAGQTIPNAALPLLPLVDVVLWYQRQTEPVELAALRVRFKISRATAFRWLWALRRMDDSDAIAGALQPVVALRGVGVRRALKFAQAPTEARP